MQSSWPRTIVHADLDAFYAQVEQLDDPSLCGRALVVGPRSNRGVVLTASYEARRFGVKSAMPMAEALRRCPHLLSVPPRFERYQELSRSMMDVFADFSPQVEAISLDEAFLEMTGAEAIFGAPLPMARKLKSAVKDATGGLTVSVGVASTKYVAKVASDFNKPDGLTIVQPQNAVQWLDPMPVSRLWGAGPKTVPRLQRIGLYTIGDVRKACPQWMKRMLGSYGAHFQALANAQDPRRVAGRRRSRSMGSDRTLLNDVVTPEDIALHLRQSAERLGTRLRAKRFLAGGVRVRLKTSNFKLLTRQVSLPEPASCSDLLYQTALGLLSRFTGQCDDGDGNWVSDKDLKFRLVGMAVFDLVGENDPCQLDLFSFDSRQSELERTIDAAGEKFGSGAVVRASSLGGRKTLAAGNPTLDYLDIEN